MGVFVPQERKNARARPGRHAEQIKQAGQIAHVAKLQHRARAKLIEALGGQPQHFGLFGRRHGADALKPHLADLGKSMAFAAGAADLLIVIIFLAGAGRGLGVFRNRKGHIGADGPQFAVKVGEGDDLRIRQKILVLLV